ncbi:MAG: ABC transporter ATP-binding protein [Spirochaetia bacterium]|nr:ABC transporter ATP-binding protein [Spirochaetia bacterium]
MNSILSVKNIKKSYRDGEVTVNVIHDINMELARGDFVSIQGASGAGKSTFLSILGAILLPDSGTITINGKNLEDYSREGKIHEYRKNHIGFIFQSHYLMPDFTAMENVMIPLLMRGIKNQAAKQKAMEILSKVGLKERANHYPSQLSGGESQRVAVARAVAPEPDIVLADEPTGNLDSHNKKIFIQVLEDLQKSRDLTVLVVTHEQDLAAAAGRRYFMKDGYLSQM